MKVRLKDIQDRYRRMSDAELRAIRPNELTPAGLRCYLDEISSRDFAKNQTPLAISEPLIERAKALREKIRREAEAPAPPRVSGFRVTIDELAARFERMTDEELLRLEPKDLTVQALGQYTKEAARRGLSVELPPEVVPAPPPIVETSEVSALLSRAKDWKERQRADDLEVNPYFQSGVMNSLTALISFGRFVREQQAWLAVNRHPVLWLRRFRSRREDIVVTSLLTEACRGLATVVTIQDETVSYSFDRGFDRLKWPIASLMMTVMIARFLPVETAVIVYLSVFAAIAAAALLVWCFRGLGVTTISDEHPAEQVAEIVQGIKQGVGVGSHEPLVLKCNDQNWQKTVATAEALCDAIMIDVADLSTNMEWELAAALRLAPSKSVILVCGLEASSGEEFQNLIVARMRKILGSDLDNCPVFFFPLDTDRAAAGTSWPSAERLQRLLAEAIVHKKRHEVS